MKEKKNILKRIGQSRFVARLVNTSKNRSLPGFDDITLFEAFKGFRKQLKEDNIIERAAAISYNFFMAIPPTLIFLLTLAPIILQSLPIHVKLGEEMIKLVENIIPDPSYNGPIIESFNTILNGQRPGLLSVGILLSLFFSSNAIMGLMRSFDKELPGFVKRKGLQKRGNALKVTLVLDALFVLCIVLLVAQGTVLDWIGIKEGWLKTLITDTRWILIALLFLNIVCYIYRAVPSVAKKWRWVTPGAVFATLFMMLLVFGFSWWLNSFGNFNELYGSLGAVLIVLIYIFINSLILLIGFEINVSIHYGIHKRDANKEIPMAEDVLI